MVNVSIIMPMYNSEKFIEKTIDSVISQSYKDWEMLIVDDCSTDNSKIVVQTFSKQDKRIKYFKTESSSGSPALPRNIGIEKAQGRFIAFLDSDDLWEKDKLETQLPLFDDNSVALVYSNYEKINEEGMSDNRIIIAPDYVDYNRLLRGNIIACCTCVYDTYKVGKQYFTKQGHEDYALWLQILKKGFIAKNSGFISAKYRVRDSSVSSNKLKTIRWVYTIFRNNENLSIMESIFFTSITLLKSFFKYLK